jgi:hypothetical protein
VYDRDGKLVHDIDVHIPQADTVKVTDVAMKSDGTPAVSLTYTPATDGYGGGIALLDLAGKLTRLIHTGLYVPLHVCRGEDDSIWTIGWQRDPVLLVRKDREDYFVFRKYSPDGKLVGSFLQRSSVPWGLTVGGYGRWAMRAAKDRIGVWAWETAEDPREWIELDYEGNLLGHWVLKPKVLPGDELPAESSARGARTCHPVFVRGPYPYSLAFTSDGELYGAGGAGLMRFDRGTANWKEIAELPRGLGLLLGTDKNNLVFAASGAGLELRWLRPE